MPVVAVRHTGSRVLVSPAFRQSPTYSPHLYLQSTTHASSCGSVGQAMPLPPGVGCLSTTTCLVFFPVSWLQAPYGPQCHTQSPQGRVGDTQGAPPLSGKTSGIQLLVWVCVNGSQGPQGVFCLQMQSTGGQALLNKSVIIPSRLGPLMSSIFKNKEGSDATSLKCVSKGLPNSH